MVFFSNDSLSPLSQERHEFTREVSKRLQNTTTYHLGESRSNSTPFRSYHDPTEKSHNGHSSSKLRSALLQKLRALHSTKKEKSDELTTERQYRQLKEDQQNHDITFQEDLELQALYEDLESSYSWSPRLSVHGSPLSSRCEKFSTSRMSKSSGRRSRLSIMNRLSKTRRDSNPKSTVKICDLVELYCKQNITEDEHLYSSLVTSCDCSRTSSRRDQLPHSSYDPSIDLYIVAHQPNDQQQEEEEPIPTMEFNQLFLYKSQSSRLDLSGEDEEQGIAVKAVDAGVNFSTLNQVVPTSAACYDMESDSYSDYDDADLDDSVCGETSSESGDDDVYSCDRDDADESTQERNQYQIQELNTESTENAKTSLKVEMSAEADSVSQDKLFSFDTDRKNDRVKYVPDNDGFGSRTLENPDTPLGNPNTPLELDVLNDKSLDLNDPEWETVSSSYGSSYASTSHGSSKAGSAASSMVFSDYTGSYSSLGSNPVVGGGNEDDSFLHNSCKKDSMEDLSLASRKQMVDRVERTWSGFSSSVMRITSCKQREDEKHDGVEERLKSKKTRIGRLSSKSKARSKSKKNIFNRNESKVPDDQMAEKRANKNKQKKTIFLKSQWLDENEKKRLEKEFEEMKNSMDDLLKKMDCVFKT